MYLGKKSLFEDLERMFEDLGYKFEDSEHKFQVFELRFLLVLELTCSASLSFSLCLSWHPLP